MANAETMKKVVQLWANIEEVIPEGTDPQTLLTAAAVFFVSTTNACEDVCKDVDVRSHAYKLLDTYFNTLDKARQ